jgi:hypothetical protein
MNNGIIAVALAIHGLAILIIASACMWNFRRLADLSLAVTRIENEVRSDSGLQKIVCDAERLGSLKDSIVHAT